MSSQSYAFFSRYLTLRCPIIAYDHYLSYIIIIFVATLVKLCVGGYLLLFDYLLIFFFISFALSTVCCKYVLGKLGEAEPLFREGLTGSRITLGDRHPDTLSAINNLGSLLHEQGEGCLTDIWYLCFSVDRFCDLSAELDFIITAILCIIIVIIIYRSRLTLWLLFVKYYHHFCYDTC